MSIANCKFEESSAGRSKGRQPVFSNRKLETGNRQFLCWQGWGVRVPADWNVVKIEGDYRAGLLLLADLESAKLGIRWATAGKSNSDNNSIVRHALQQEVGELAAAEAKALPADPESALACQFIYEDADPPGRDVFIGLTKDSRRLIQVSYQCKHRDRVLRDVILPELTDQPTGEQRWAVLDLSCTVPEEFKLKSHQLSAGDLRLSFAVKQQQLDVRQVGPATLALARQSIAKWLAADVSPMSKHYRVGSTTDFAVDALHGLSVKLIRRRRAFLHRSLPVELFACVVVDEHRNRLVFVRANDEAIVKRMIPTIGWASPVREQA